MVAKSGQPKAPSNDTRLRRQCAEAINVANGICRSCYKSEAGVKPSANPEGFEWFVAYGAGSESFPLGTTHALFQKYHIGGCSSCGYMPHDTLDKVSRDHGLETGVVVTFIKESAKLEQDIEISPAEVAELLKKGAVKLLDVRTPQEYSNAHVEGSVLVDQSVAQEIVSTWL